LDFVRPGNPQKTSGCPGTFFALVLRKELLDRLAATRGGVPEWQCIIDDLLDLSAVEVEQDGRRALGLTPPPVFDGVVPKSLVH
jgi:hypothetical protein